MYELIIVGAGPAGITASVYAARKRINFLVITENIGGQTALSGDIENYTGYQFITGSDLTAKFEEHMKKYGVELKEGERVLEVCRKNDVVSVRTDKDNYEARTAIIASGKKSRELGIAGEKEFRNKGVTYCATCDGPLFAGKEVAVIGGGNAGLEAVIQLVKIAKRIYLIEATPELTGDAILEERIKQEEKVIILKNTKVLSIIGDKMVNGLQIRSEKGEEMLAVEGVFVEIGLMPNSEFAKDVEKNEHGEIKVDSCNKTSVKGIFAAGDVTDVPEKQIIIAAGEGAKATLSAFKFLTKQKL